MSTMSTNSPASQPPVSPHPHSPNPNAPAFRPSPARAATLSGIPFQYKTRAASQPAGERIPNLSGAPIPSRGSPAMNGNGNGNGGAFGVIGGPRTPSRFGSALPIGGTATRANSFSAGEIREPREFFPSRSQSTSPFPTFSPNSTPSTSPAAIRQHPLPPSPPKVGANASRSRSQSLATGVRPSNIDRPWLGTMSTLENNGTFARIETGWNISPPEGASNMSPFSRGSSTLTGNALKDEAYGKNGANQLPAGRFRAAQEAITPRGSWGASAPEKNNAALSSSVHRALGGEYEQGHPARYESAHADYNGNGGRSGTSSRRHSVSVVGGPGGRREYAFGEGGMGITPLASPPSRGLFGLASDLGNALSLDIDDQQRPESNGRNAFTAANLPRFDLLTSAGHQRVSSLNQTKADEYGQGLFPAFGSTPPNARMYLGLMGERAPLGDSKDTSYTGRFGMDNAAVGSPVRPDIRIGPNGMIGPGSPERPRDGLPPVRGPAGPGVIGSPASFNIPPPFAVGSPGTFPNIRPYGAPLGPGQHMGNGSGPGHLGGNFPPNMGGLQQFGRPPQGFGGYYGGAPARPPLGGGPGLGIGSTPGSGSGLFGSPQPGLNVGPGSGSGSNGLGYNGQPSGPAGYSPFHPPVPSSPPQPASPSFSSLSLSDLGKGISLVSLPPTTPLYIVTFKAGRRDVYYCPDPTLLISNGDKVIVEADRGSDLGTVVYDQLTPMDVRDWQERQATAALLSGASQHQPPGMAVASGTNGQQQLEGHKRIPSNPAAKEIGYVANMNLDQLLAGVGPSGQMELTGTSVRGPLAKEVMPKRIFAKSSQGPEEQARMRDKAQDEYDAMMICRDKVVQRGLPMTIVDAEYQWDRRKLTFYFKADKRVDFRDLTKENFRIFKSRIWMSMVSKDDPRL